MDRIEQGDEIFERLIRAHDDTVWTAFATQYRRLLIAWAARCPATVASGESAEAIADQALARAWVALSAKGFSGFPTLAAFLAYLRRCVTHTAIDAARSWATPAQTATRLTVRESLDPEQALLEQLERAELWQLVNSLIATEQERVVLVERYVLDLAPRVILARHPLLFADVTAIYAAVRNLCCRLQRHRDLRQLWEEHLAA